MTVSGVADVALIVTVVATLTMTGLVWFVQIVHYPLFALVPERGLPAYAVEHARRTGRVVGPLMLLEMASAVTLAVVRPDGVSAVLAWVGLGLLVAVWLMTALVQVPAHRALAAGGGHEGARRLVAGSLPRTVVWTVRAGVVVAMLAQALS